MYVLFGNDDMEHSADVLMFRCFDFSESPISRDIIFVAQPPLRLTPPLLLPGVRSCCRLYCDTAACALCSWCLPRMPDAEALPPPPLPPLEQLFSLLLPDAPGASTAQLAARLRSVTDAVSALAAREQSAARDVAKAAARRRAAAACKEPPPPFDIALYPSRLVALEIFYCGWGYHGFATQGRVCGREIMRSPDVCFAATAPARAKRWRRTSLPRCAPRGWWRRTRRGARASTAAPGAPTKARAPSVESFFFHCTSTLTLPSAAAGVSALRQTVVLRVRAEAAGAVALDYVGSLNRQLPRDIRVLAWRPAPAGFSARFSARRRVYKYVFHASRDCDLGAMRDAANRFVGLHDFRNVCKPDVDAVASFVRRVISCMVDPEPEALDAPADRCASNGCDVAACSYSSHCLSSRHQPPLGRLFAVNVTGSSFLWHQVRCMVAVLLMVGARLEAPHVVDSLLDVATVGGKPAYDMAPEEPLVLLCAGYDDGALQEEEGFTPLRSRALLRAHMASLARAAAVRRRVACLGFEAVSAAGEAEYGGGDAAPDALERGRPHVALLRRRREAGVEEQRARRGGAPAGAPAGEGAAAEARAGGAVASS